MYGIEFLDNNALISLSGLKVGDKIEIPGDDISDAIKKLWKQGIIGNIGISPRVQERFNQAHFLVLHGDCQCGSPEVILCIHIRAT